MRQARIIQQASESRGTDGSLADVLMAVEFRAKSSFCVIAVPNRNVLEADQLVNLPQRGFVPRRRDDIVARCVDGRYPCTQPPG
jgi:hypothetical protein